MSQEKIMPVVFCGHGSPTNAIGDNRARRGWIALGQQLGKPRAIVAVSAHWATRGTLVRTAADNPTINDMYGFPKELYEVGYSPAGDPELARRVLDLLGDANEDNSWGIDHGVWSVLSNMYPQADVPVVMVSTDTNTSPAKLMDIGRRLQPLRREGVLIVASGNIVHNLRLTDWKNPNGAVWADAFDQTVKEAVLDGDFDTAADFLDLEDADLAVPTPEHFQPFIVTLGAASPQDKVTVFNDYRELASMSMTSYLFEAPSPVKGA